MAVTAPATARRHPYSHRAFHTHCLWSSISQKLIHFIYSTAQLIDASKLQPATTRVFRSSLAQIPVKPGPSMTDVHLDVV